jgi:hypothetical protein
MNRSLLFSASALVLLFGMPLSHAGWSDYLDVLKGAVGEGGEQTAVTTPAAALSSGEMVSGLKEALQNGVRFAIDKLGAENGFLGNDLVRIPMPDSLSWVEKSLRTLRQDRLADEFVASMNHAAEQAVPQAAEIFGNAISQMSVEDAQSILKGPDDAATQYFRTNTEAALTERMLPIVKQATGDAGVTSAYKGMMSKAGGLTSLLSSDTTDLDGYVTEKALDGLFLMVAQEEKRIRENPVARTTDLLKKVFGTVSP